MYAPNYLPSREAALMWEPVEVAPGGILIAVGWIAAPTLVIASWVADVSALGQMGIVIAAAAATLTVIRDNQRTRRLLAKPVAAASPLRTTR